MKLISNCTPRNPIVNEIEVEVEHKGKLSPGISWACLRKTKINFMFSTFCSEIVEPASKTCFKVFLTKVVELKRSL